MAKAKTSMASQANAMSSSLVLIFWLFVLKGSWSSAGDPLERPRLPAAEAQATRMMAVMIDWLGMWLAPASKSWVAKRWEMLRITT